MSCLFALTLLLLLLLLLSSQSALLLFFLCRGVGGQVGSMKSHKSEVAIT